MNNTFRVRDQAEPQHKAQFHAPIFYSDAHCRYEMSIGPRYVNVFVTDNGPVTGSAFVRRETADKFLCNIPLGRAAYRIVVKPKAVSA